MLVHLACVGNRILVVEALHVAVLCVHREAGKMFRNCLSNAIDP